MSTIEQSSVTRSLAEMLYATADLHRENVNGVLAALLEQCQQMQGMFDDEDGTIQAAIDDAEAYLSGRGCIC